MPIPSPTPFSDMLDAQYPDRHHLSRIARQLLVFLQMQLAPPAPGPKTNLLLRLWQRCEEGSAAWPDYYPSQSGIRQCDDYNFIRWLLGAGVETAESGLPLGAAGPSLLRPERTAAVIAAARSDSATATALALLASRGRSGRDHETRGRQWFDAMIRYEQRWYASLLTILEGP